MRTHIMIHHSFTDDSKTVSWPAIEKYHRETNGWRDIGYHRGVELVTADPGLASYRYQALIGRADRDQAAACPQGNMNVLALHVCCVGNYDLAPPPDELLIVLRNRVLVPWMQEFGITPERIVGHRDFNPAKSCPGLKFDLDKLREMVR